MATQEIIIEAWGGFFEQFSKEHQGKPASLQVFGPGTGSHREARSLPFVGISVDRKGSAAGSINIMLGNEASDHISHEVGDPTQVWLDSGEDLGQQVLEIRSEDGQNVLLRIN